jgi:AraC-like DNA-binding protein
MAQAARRLGLSTRTLRRRLEQENTSYQDLLDQFRRDLALEYLRSGHMAPKEIAYVLGFSSPSTFRRAFKTWTNETVGEFLDREHPSRDRSLS